MAQLLTTKSLAAQLEEIIRKSKGEVYLISYSFRISQSFLRQIRNAVDKGIKIKIVYGKFIYENTMEELGDIKNLEIYYCENLHAKVYANESKCIVGSMNFYEYSEINNIELGVLLTEKEDSDAFNDTLEQCKEIFKEASRGAQTRKPSKEKFPDGYCIRTGKKIPLNHERPFSEEAYQSWAFWGNPDYAEQFCHFTGEPSMGQTSMNHPVLSKNWNAYTKLMFKDEF